MVWFGWLLVVMGLLRGFGFDCGFGWVLWCFSGGRVGLGSG